MRDHPQLKMFLQEGSQYIVILGHTSPGMVIVSTFDPSETEENNVLALRELYKVGPQRVAPDLIYGDDFGVVLLCGSHEYLPVIRKYCLEAAKTFKQKGCVVWDDPKAELWTVDGGRSPLPPWDGSESRLEEWIGALHPGFKIRGIWNREMTYVNMKCHEYGM